MSPSDEPAEDRAGDAAQATQDDDDERLQQRLLAHHRVELEDRRHERAGRRGQREADGEGEAVDRRAR